MKNTAFAMMSHVPALKRPEARVQGQLLLQLKEGLESIVQVIPAILDDGRSFGRRCHP